MNGRMLLLGTINTFSDAVARLDGPDLDSKSITQKVLTDKDQPGAMREVMRIIRLVLISNIILMFPVQYFVG